MNRVKSLFISVWLTLLFVGLGRALWQLTHVPADTYGWSAVMIALLPAIVFFSWLLLFSVARTGYVAMLLWVAPLIASIALLLRAVHQVEIWTWTAGVGLLGGVLYVRWYSRFGSRDSETLTVGANLPPLAFEQADGSVLDTASLDGPKLMIFYRGNWCPLCMAQIKEVAGQYRQLAEKGVSVMLISPQPHSNTEDLAARFDAPMRFLVDKDNRVAKQLGIDAQAGLPAGMEILGYDSDTVMPTVVITDASDTIIFADLTDNYRRRPEPEVFLAVLAEAGM